MRSLRGGIPMKQCGAIEEVKWHRSSRINSSNANGTISPNGVFFAEDDSILWQSSIRRESTWNMKLILYGQHIQGGAFAIYSMTSRSWTMVIASRSMNNKSSISSYPTFRLSYNHTLIIMIHDIDISTCPSYLLSLL